ncbi:hypothetical protein HMPREF1545_02154 [Oscillibacter sp. KLE 1728]|nr:hypothetical protein HMPREF1545_02154 [Oscillibacter sp. KLE 1728]ERK67288.1 hypothetical protein HMPREF1546_00524 [Oscillibacter sp. KLE 1745]
MRCSTVSSGTGWPKRRSRSPDSGSEMIEKGGGLASSLRIWRKRPAG